MYHYYNMSNDELLTPEESAAYLKMHVDSVRRLLRTGKLPGKKMGGGWRISRSILDALIRGDPQAPVPDGSGVPD